MGISVLSFIIGIMSLWLGGGWLVKGAQSIGYRLHLSPLFVGLTLVAFGTSAPELIVNLIASYNGQPDIVFGNIIGSNLANILLILGCAGLIFPLPFQKSKLIKESMYTILFPGSLAVLLLIIPPVMELTRLKSIILLALFVYFLIMLFIKKSPESLVSSSPQYSVLLAVLYLILGVILLPIGGQLVINSATTIALSWGVSQALVSLIAIAIGTSLPELATSVMAAVRHDTDIAIGNILGSNIFNIGLILTLSGLVSPLHLSPILVQDLYILVAVSLLFAVGIMIKKSSQLSRSESVLLLCGYGLFLLFVITRG
jgi:cation:H+ antiporter